MDKGLLNEATSPDDTPTPGYMITEISSLFSSLFSPDLTQFPSVGLTIANYQACLQLIDFLNARLKKNNHNVKYKCLIIIKVRAALSLTNLIDSSVIHSKFVELEEQILRKRWEGIWSP
jgi:hypothetical protein